MFQLQALRQAWGRFIVRRRAVINAEFCAWISARSKRELADNRIRSARAYKRHGFNPRRAVWSRPRWTSSWGFMVSYDEHWFHKRHK